VLRRNRGPHACEAQWRRASAGAGGKGACKGLVRCLFGGRFREQLEGQPSGQFAPDARVSGSETPPHEQVKENGVALAPGVSLRWPSRG
jgi:hypothetical protein